MKNNNCIRHAPYLRNSIAYDHDFWCTCVKWWYLQVLFLQVFKILIFWVVSGVKGQKTVQNDKKICPSFLISQEPYITWLPFMVHMCKMIISKKTLSVTLHISGTIHHVIVIYGTLVENDNISRCFFHFLEVFIWGVKGQKMVHNN